MAATRFHDNRRNSSSHLVSERRKKRKQSILVKQQKNMKLKLASLFGFIIFSTQASSAFAYSLWATGDNYVGQLSMGGLTYYVRTPQVVAGKVTAVSAGSTHSMFIKSDNTLWASGFNASGQLGDGTNINRSYAVLVAKDVASVACGAQHSLYIKNDGTLWGTGSNEYGELGLGSTKTITIAEKISNDVIAVSAGARFSLFLKKDGSLWGMGSNSDYQLTGKNPDSNKRLTPILIASNVAAMAAGGSAHSVFLKKDGILMGMGSGFYGQLGSSYSSVQPIQIDSNVSAVSAGAESTLYVKSDGSLWLTGRLGNLTDHRKVTQIDTNVTAIAAGYDHILYSKKDDSVWSMGTNMWGQLGNDGSTEISSPVKLPITGAVQLAAGFRSSYFIIKEPRLFSLAVRTTLAADQIVIVGFTMTGGPKNVLLRAAGPSLAAFGLGNAMLNPKLDIYDGPVKVAQNDNWGGSTALLSAFQSVGAFGFSSASSQDAAVVTSIEGSRTMHVSGPTGGIVLVEGYDLGEGDTARFAGLSARNNVGTGANILIAGFTLKGSGVANLLIRAIGPTLQAFGIENFLQDPKLEIYSGGALIASNDNWVRDPAYSAIGFSLFNNSKDSVAPVWLPAGAYTAHVSGVNGSVGDCIIEVLEIR